MRAKHLRTFAAIAGVVALLGCRRTDDTPGNSMRGNEQPFQVIVQDLGNPEGVRDLGFDDTEFPDVLGLGGEPWQSLAPEKNERARSLVNDAARVSATFELSTTDQVAGFRAQSGVTGKCGDKDAVLRLIDTAVIGINPPITLNSTSKNALRQALWFNGRTSVSTGGISIQTGSDGCIHWIDVRPEAR